MYNFFDLFYLYVLSAWCLLFFSHSRQESPSGFLFSVLCSTAVVPIFLFGLVFAGISVLSFVPGTLIPDIKYFICFPLFSFGVEFGLNDLWHSSTHEHFVRPAFLFVVIL